MLSSGRTRGDYDRDGPEVGVSLARVPSARPRSLSRLRRGRLPARVATGSRAVARPARIPVRPGARDRGGRGAPPLAGPRRPDAAPLARARRGRVLRNLLLRVGDAVLPRPRVVWTRRPHARAARARAVRVLASVGARAPPTRPDRDCGRPRAASAARTALA